MSDDFVTVDPLDRVEKAPEIPTMETTNEEKPQEEIPPQEPTSHPMNCFPLARFAKRRAPINIAKNKDVFMVTIDDLPPYYTTSIAKAKAVIKRYFSTLITYTGYEGYRTEDEPFRMRLLRKSTVAFISYERVESVATIQSLPLLI